MRDLEKILFDIIADGYLEDRLEYDAEMLARMYSLTIAEAEKLHCMIQEAK